MTKHSRQHQDVVSAHERAHINSFLGNKWGTLECREGSDARGSFDDCCICLHAAKEPVISNPGDVFCKGCIYEFLLTQKQEKKKQLEAWEKQEAESKVSSEVTEEAKEAEEIRKFEAIEKSVKTGLSNSVGFSAAKGQRKRKAEAGVGPAAGYKAFKTDNGNVFLVDEEQYQTNKELGVANTEAEEKKRREVFPCFWIPNLTPAAAKDKVVKPSTGLRGPFGNTIKLKQLHPIQYTLTPECIKNPKLSKERYMCPISKKTLTNGQNIYFVKSTGDVFLGDGLKLVLEDRTYDGKKVKKKDVIQFKNTGSGFAAGGARMVKSQNNPAFTYA